MRSLLLVVQYDGTDYHGFQRQPELPTVQGELENALSALLNEDVVVTGAGRTDAGVHAVGQIVTFETERPIPVDRIVRALNSMLPDAVTALEAREVSADFHPRYDARGKVYGYRILNREEPSPFIGRYAWHLPEPLDVSLMREAATSLLGTHDFVAYSSSGGSEGDTVRTLQRLDMDRHGDLIELRLEASGFLYMMARRIVGTLVDVGAGRIGVADVKALLESRDRRRAGTIAPPNGLSLITVIY